MLGFVIPFKPRKQTGDWEKDNALLRQTVNCLLNQTNTNYKIYIVYTDVPSLILADEKIRLIKSPFPFLEFNQLENNAEIFYYHKDEKLAERRMDKGKKITYGSSLAKQEGCNYIMSVDADDLVSNALVDFVERNNKNNTAPGWYIRKGYILKTNSKMLVKNFHMNLFNGSTHILRADLVKIPDFTSTDWHDYSLFTSHGWITYRVKEYANEHLSPLSFFGVIYIVHKNNLSNIGDIASHKSLKNIVKQLIFGRKINKKIIKEFSITGHKDTQ